MIYSLNLVVNLNHSLIILCKVKFIPIPVGLDAAGKTTILYKLKLGEIVTTIPTIGESTSSLHNITNGDSPTCPVLELYHPAILDGGQFLI